MLNQDQTLSTPFPPLSGTSLTRESPLLGTAHASLVRKEERGGFLGSFAGLVSPPVVGAAFPALLLLSTVFLSSLAFLVWLFFWPVETLPMCCSRS